MIAPKPPPLPRRLRWVTVLLVVVILVAAALVVAQIAHVHCAGTGITDTGDLPALMSSDVWDSGGECVGVAEPLPALYPIFGAELATLAKLNEAAQEEKAAHPSRQVITVVYLGVLTAPDFGADSLATEREGLRGLAIAQQWQLRASTAKTYPLIRMLVANGGTLMAHGPQVAEVIASAARRDPSIVGVAGLSESYSATERTVATLSKAGIPTVSAFASADSLEAAGGAQYFQIAPLNAREAAVAAAYARSHAASWHMPGNAPVWIYTSANPDDVYSANLARDAQRQFSQLGFRPRIVGFAPDSSGPAGGPAELPSARAAGQKACELSGLIFYAGRPIPDFGSFLDGLHGCPNPSFRHLIADDDTTRYVADDEARSQHTGIDFDYLAYATLPPGEQQVDQGFDASYLDISATERWPTDLSNLLDGHAALTFDAAQTFVNAVVENPPAHTVSASAMSGYLATMSGFTGASGFIDFAGHRHVPADKPILVLTLTAGIPQRTAYCGPSQPQHPGLTQLVSDPWCPHD